MTVQFASGGSFPDNVSVYNSIVACLAAHPDWTFVEEVAAGTTTQAHISVWKSTNVGQPEFHIGIYRANTTTGAFGLLLFEGYDPATNTFSRPAPLVGPAGLLPPSEDGSYGGGATYPLTSGTDKNSLLPYFGKTSGNPTGWVFAVSRKGVWFTPISGSTGTQAMVYAGLLESLTLASDPVPTCMVDRTKGGTDAVVFTRYPTVTSAQAGNWWGALSRWTQWSGVLNGALDRLYNQRAVGARLVVSHTDVTGATAGALSRYATHGGNRGLIPDTLEFRYATSNNPGLLDQMDIAGETWRVVGHYSADTCWLVRVNAA